MILINKDVPDFVSSLSTNFIEMHLFVLKNKYVYLFVIANIGQTRNTTRYFCVCGDLTSNYRTQYCLFYSCFWAKNRLNDFILDYHCAMFYTTVNIRWKLWHFLFTILWSNSNCSLWNIWNLFLSLRCSLIYVEILSQMDQVFLVIWYERVVTSNISLHDSSEICCEQKWSRGSMVLKDFLCAFQPRCSSFLTRPRNIFREDSTVCCDQYLNKCTVYAIFFVIFHQHTH